MRRRLVISVAMMCLVAPAVAAEFTAAPDKAAADPRLSSSTLAEAWNGTSWTTQPTPNPTGSLASQLLGVSCVTAALCKAVGYHTDSAGAFVALAERWNGTTWRIKPMPVPTGAKSSQLNGVSCTAAAACTAVGYYTNSAGVPMTLVERWNGTSWAIRPSLDPVGALRSQLFGVSCTSARVCTAVGFYITSGGAYRALAEAWNPTSLAIQPVPLPIGATGSQLRDVSCTSATACTADWYYTNSAGTKLTLVEAWNGTSWAIQPSPNPTGATGSQLRGISCTSVAACTAVGSYTNSAGATLTLVEAWNGTSWAIQPSPNPTGTSNTQFKSLSCTSTTACTAVGEYTTSAGTQLTLAERWSGSSWTVQPMPSLPGTISSLPDVSCTSPTACTAVGSQ